MRNWLARAVRLPGAPGFFVLAVSREEWRRVAGDAAAVGGRLISLWGGHDGGQVPVVHATLLVGQAALWIRLSLTTPGEPYPGFEDLFPAALRMQRATADLSGLRSTCLDARPWLQHGHWPREFRPLFDGPGQEVAHDPAGNDYDFVRVEGDGVHEIPVGPVHAGIIEPGHFRFSVVGEKVLRLEQRLGYVHKGIERRFSQLPILQAHRLAARVSGDTAVAYTWAYCQAVEGMAGVTIPPRAAWLRALCLELERVANHLGDLGALGNDAGFAFGLMQFSRLKEDLLRAMHDALGARYLLDAIVPGGIGIDLSHSGAGRLEMTVRNIAPEASRLRGIYDEHEGVRDRFAGAGTIRPELAARLGLTGLAGRASGQAFDLRVDLPCHPYTELVPEKAGCTDGDVAARVTVRFDELQVSCRLVLRILESLPAGEHVIPVPVPADGATGAGLIEGWRGPVFIALEADADGTVRRCHPHDPSWQNWPALEHAVIDNIVPDFPLINKSFNLSYSGHDL